MPMESVVMELEGTLLKNPDPYSYFMLVAFEGSGLIRFTTLMMAWPVIRFLHKLNMRDAGLKLAIFISVAGLRQSEIESVGRAVLPKFYMDDIDIRAWRMFSCYEKRVVVTTSPRLMVERFVRDHLGAVEVIGSELQVNRFGFATGLIMEDMCFLRNRVKGYIKDEKPAVGSSRSMLIISDFLSICKEQHQLPFITNQNCHIKQENLPHPVIFHDGRLVKRPTASVALLIFLWLPLGIILAVVRIIICITLAWRSVHPCIMYRIIGGKLVVKGPTPPPPSISNNGVLFVCTHRTLLDAVFLSVVLGRKVPTVSYSLSRLSEILSPIQTLRLTRRREVDAEIIQSKLKEGDLVVCPEGTTCREPFLLRFSALFAELTDQIVPVAMDCKVGFFHATTARGWKALDFIFFFMNPRPVYEVTFLNKLPTDETCSSGKSPHEVANNVQSMLAATLGFQSTNLTRKDKYRLLAGNDGTFSNKGK
ncbi:hypothetical protein AQUCO_01000671v1 [Aquilegia coerulea]|uniref:Phospholipid/glycerol acyltransferase domain-containing protein n=1 Tax=Aquilegia coerulea TaxID=218851 RepID=A0A2G5EBM3_AQUCA|nr:hypothetical protein AQUCO_01000671v1 [Aquilegia coerulea]